MIYDMKECGKRIQQVRIQKGYTQEGLAGKLNIGQSFLSRVESGRKGCSVDLLVQLSELFHVSLDVLILGQEAEKATKDEDGAKLKKSITELIDQLVQFQNQL